MSKTTIVQNAVTGKFEVVDEHGKALSTHDTFEDAQKAAGVTVTKKQGVAVHADTATGKFNVVAADGTTVSVHATRDEAQKALSHKPTQLPADTATKPADKDDDDKDDDDEKGGRLTPGKKK